MRKAPNPDRDERQYCREVGRSPVPSPEAGRDSSKGKGTRES